MGAPAAADRVGDEWIWAEFWTRYFTDREPRHTWVVPRRADGAVVGYLTGTADVRRVDAYAPFLLPGIVWRVARKRPWRRAAPRRALLGLLRSLLAGEMALPHGVARRYPAAFHVNLLPEARGRGLARALFDAFAAQLRTEGVRGVHAQVLSVNEPVQRFLRRAGFRMVASRPCRALAHVESRVIDVGTWVLRFCE